MLPYYSVLRAVLYCNTDYSVIRYKTTSTVAEMVIVINKTFENRDYTIQFKRA